MDVVLYGRVSTQMQASKGVSLEDQDDKLLAWAKDKNILGGGVFLDKGISGKSIRGRPQFVAALKLACENKATLVVYSITRLSRSLPDLLQIMEDIKKSGASVISLTQTIDMSTAEGRMFFSIVGSFAQYEREIASERTRNAKLYQLGKLQNISPMPPFGFRVSKDKKTIVEYKWRTKATEKMQQLRSRGVSYRAIAIDISSLGWGPVSHTTVKKLLDKVLQK